jgi:biotin transport system substrate-specific component
MAVARRAPLLSRRGVAASAGVIAFAVLTFVGAHVYIPLTPVPVTLQTLFVLLAGAVAGPRRGASSQALYVGAGACGLPLFAGWSAGWSVLAGPTGGYLLSFLVVPLFVGSLIGRSDTIRWQLFVFVSATTLIFTFGILHLTIVYGLEPVIAVEVGLIPFLPGAAFKIFAAISILRSFRSLTGRRSS